MNLFNFYLYRSVSIIRLPLFPSDTYLCLPFGKRQPAMAQSRHRILKSSLHLHIPRHYLVCVNSNAPKRKVRFIFRGLIIRGSTYAN